MSITTSARLLSADAAGAFVVGLEDEFFEVGQICRDLVRLIGCDDDFSSINLSDLFMLVSLLISVTHCPGPFGSSKQHMW